jgi:signal transduction histidine kinase
MACPKAWDGWCDSESDVAIREPSDKLAFSLANLPATSGQRRLALAVVVLQFMICAVVAPLAPPAPRIDGFIPVVLAIVFVADLITAVLLFNQSAVIVSRALLVLASGYLFSALIVIPHALTFPGAFAPKGLLGAGVQSSGWLNALWHFGFLVAVAGYACLKDEEPRNDAIRPSALTAFCWSVAIQTILVCALTWAVTAGDSFMPRMFSDDLRMAPLGRYVAGMLALMSVVVLLLMWARRTSVLDLWVMVAICMLISEMALVAFGMTSRFYLGWYVSRALAVGVATVVLIALLSESMTLHAALSRANMMLKRERDNKLMNAQALVATIAHEVRQPLTRIISGGNAAQRFLKMTPSEQDKAQTALEGIVNAGHRTSEIIDGFRALFTESDQEQQLVDISEIIGAVLQSLSNELKDHQIELRSELMPDLPPVYGNKSQLQEVVSNLTINAIEAMETSSNQDRVLHVGTELCDGTAIKVAIEDSGPGIDKDKLDGIFTAFVTTKRHGMGLGLAISRMIVEYHGGKLTASAGQKGGASFQFLLPIASVHARAEQSGQMADRDKSLS